MAVNENPTRELRFPLIDAERTGKHVFRLLESHGYNPKETAEILGFQNTQTVYNWKYGTRMPSIDNLDRLSRLLNISINDLLVHDGDPEVAVLLEIPGPAAAKAA